RAARESAGHLVALVDPAAFAEIPPPADGEETGEVALFVAEAGPEPVAAAAGLIADLARVAGSAAQRQVPLWLVTTGAQQQADGDASGPVGGALWGFGRVLMNETPRLTLRLLDFAPAMGWAERAGRIGEELAAAASETEIVWTDNGRHLLRLRPGLPPRSAAPDDTVTPASQPEGRLGARGWLQ